MRAEASVSSEQGKAVPPCHQMSYLMVGPGAVRMLPRWGDLRWEEGYVRQRDELKQSFCQP